MARNRGFLSASKAPDCEGTFSCFSGRLLQGSAYTPRMRRIVLAIIIASYFSPALCAQYMLGKVSCHAAGLPKPEDQPYTKKLWDRYEISLGPAHNSPDGGDEC